MNAAKHKFLNYTNVVLCFVLLVLVWFILFPPEMSKVGIRNLIGGTGEKIVFRIACGFGIALSVAILYFRTWGYNRDQQRIDNFIESRERRSEKATSIEITK